MGHEHLERGNKKIDQNADGTHGGKGQNKEKQADRSMTTPPLKTSGGVPTRAPRPSRPNRGADGRDAPAGARPSGNNAAGAGASTPDIDAQTGSEMADDVETAGNKFPQTAAADEGPVEGDRADDAEDDVEGEDTAGDEIDTADARGPTHGPDKNLF